mmetsp:Transcript_8616/g.22405  ORF Transcript_8616/g.22405 Transcript_8616/m.22405 type:complete len:171 (+) Transcript_8616:563-1075(+)
MAAWGACWGTTRRVPTRKQGSSSLPTRSKRSRSPSLSRVAKRDKVRAKVLKKLRKKGHAFDTFQAARESTDPAVVNVLHKEAVVLLEQEQTIAASEAVSSGLNKVADMVLEVAGLPSDAPALREALSSGSALPAFERSAPARCHNFGRRICRHRRAPQGQGPGHHRHPGC